MAKTKRTKKTAAPAADVATTLRAGDIVKDERLSEIRNFDRYTASKYRIAMRNGAKFPPIAVEESTKVLVDGALILQAFIDEYGEDARIAVEYVVCRGFGAVVKEFTRRNIRHGRPLDAFTKTKIVHALIEAGTSCQELADLLCTDISHINEYRGRFTIVNGVKFAYKHEVPLQNRNISEAAYRLHAYQHSGSSAGKLAWELASMLENGLHDEDDKEHLLRLRDVLNSVPFSI